jgi:hypothetical protein
VAGFWESGGGSPDSVESWELLEWLSDGQLLNEHSGPVREFIFHPLLARGCVIGICNVSFTSLKISNLKYSTPVGNSYTHESFLP